MVAGRLLPLAPPELLHILDRPIASARPRSASRHLRRLRRGHDDGGALGTGRIVEGDGVVRRVRGDADEVAVDSLDQIDAGRRVIDPASVSAWARITPAALTPRWSFLQPRLPCPPCFAAAHSPSPTIVRPVLSVERATKTATGSPCACRTRFSVRTRSRGQDARRPTAGSRRRGSRSHGSSGPDGWCTPWRRPGPSDG